ncbi:hypothetical protein [Psychromonas aquatilis]|uniref:Uncharacterized protein n=1 Tax=Psychromonas aquatilis TaxID=2005072 RepID=A0ABU9GL79_9GAMM
MKNICKVLMLFLILFSVNVYSYEVDKQTTDCIVSDPKNHSQTFNELELCINEELEKDTEASEALRKAQTPYDQEEFSSKVNSVLSSFGIVIVVFAFYNLFKSLSIRNRDEKSKNTADFLFKSLVVGFLLTIIVSPQLLSYSTKLILNNLYNQPIMFYTSMNVQKSQSSTVKSSAVSNSKAQISDKVLSMSKLAIEHQSCAASYYQEILSPYDKEDYEVIMSNKEIKCIDDYLEENKNKKIQELDNRLPLPAAVHSCSSKFDSIIKDCGRIYTQSNIQPLNDVVNTYTNQMADILDDYIKYNCDLLSVNNTHHYQAFCTTITGGVKSKLTTDKTLFEIENNFFETNNNFINDFNNELVSNIEIPDEYESNVNLLDMYGNMKSFLLTDNYDYIYQKEILKEVNNISGTLSKNRNKVDGSVIQDVDGIELISEDANDFMYSIKSQTDHLFEDKEIAKNSLVDDFSFINDVKLLFGNYTDATNTEDFKVSFIPLQIVQENRNKLIAIGTATMLISKYQVSKAEVKGISSTFWDLLNTFSIILIFLALFPEIFAVFVIVFTLGGITIKLLEAICMMVIEILLILIVKKEPHLLMNRLTQLFIAMVIKPIVPIIGLAAGSLFVVIALELMKSIPLINDNTAITFCVGIIVQFFMILYLIKKTIWVNGYLHNSLKTDISGFKGNVKKSFRNIKNSI